MTTALTGLQPVAGFIDPNPEATAEERSGGPADPRHAQIGEDATPYPWEVYPGETHGPYGLDNDLLGMDVAAYELPAGTLADDPTADRTPITHAAPWPKGIVQSTDPQEIAEKRQELADIHAIGEGASLKHLYESSAVQDDWRAINDTGPGELVPGLAELPAQAKTAGMNGWASTDRTQSFARQNEYGFDSAHQQRRYAAGSIPGNYMWLDPGSRPMQKSIASGGRAPVGTDSPFYGQIPGDAYDSQGAVLTELPVAYSGPTDPAVASSYPAGPAIPDVDLW